MDGLLSLLFQSSSTSGPPSMAIPTYAQGENEDPIDLQIKSLTYIFRRCEIATSKPFLDPATDKSLRTAADALKKKTSRASADESARDSFPDSLKGISLSDQEKLDIMYNKSEFERLLVKDEHRILIDWPKNKFRSLCILSSHPIDAQRFPSFGKEKTNFGFSVLPANSPDDLYVQALSESSIYIEHNISMDIRRRLAKQAIEKHPAFELSDDGFDRVRTKSDRANIISSYLTSLGIEVQVQRLYKGSLRMKHQQAHPGITHIHGSPSSLSNQSSPSSSRSASPVLSSRSASPDSRYRPATSPASPERKLFANANLSVSPGSPARRVARSPDLSHRSASPTRPLAGSRSSSPTAPRTRQIPTFSSASASAKDHQHHKFMHSPSIPRLRTKGSISNLNLNSVPDLAPSQGLVGKSLASENHEDDIPVMVRKELLSQAILAVKNRLLRERALVARMYDPRLLK